MDKNCTLTPCARFLTHGLFMTSFSIGVSASPLADRRNLTEHYSNGTDTRVSASNCMQRIFLWLKSDEIPLTSKIAAIAFPPILAIGAWYLAGQVAMVLALLFVAVPILIWTAIEGNLLASRVEDARQREIEQKTAFQQMQNAVGGIDAFHRLPLLNIGNRRGATDYLDFITPQEMTSPVMRGEDAAKRPFICLKIRSSRPEDNGREFVVTFFQRYTEGSLWTWGSTHHRAVFGNVIRNEDREAIRQIVVDQTHPHFTLIPSP
jgi:hypothetical protein